jgi:DNA-binding beta-propeller fold protein YncE
VGGGVRLREDRRSSRTGGISVVAYDVVVSIDGKSLYVADMQDATISQYDIGAAGSLTPKAVATVPAGRRPHGVVVSPDGKSFYVTNEAEDTISEYDVDSGTGALSPKAIPTVATGHCPAGIAISPDGKNAYVANSHGDSDNGVSQYDVDAISGALTLSGRIPTGSGTWPVGVAVVDVWWGTTEGAKAGGWELLWDEPRSPVGRKTRSLELGSRFI